MTTKRTYNPAWPDTAAARTRRSNKRRARLDALAQEHGFETWDRLATAALNGEVKVTKTEDKMSKKVRNNIDTGLWVEDSRGVVTHVSENEYGQYLMTYHNGRMPAYDSKTFNSLDAVEAAMKEIAPLRDWRTKTED